MVEDEAADPPALASLWGLYGFSGGGDGLGEWHGRDVCPEIESWVPSKWRETGPRRAAAAGRKRLGTGEGRVRDRPVRWIRADAGRARSSLARAVHRLRRVGREPVDAAHRPRAADGAAQDVDTGELQDALGGRCCGSGCGRGRVGPKGGATPGETGGAMAVGEHAVVAHAHEGPR